MNWEAFFEGALSALIVLGVITIPILGYLIAWALAQVNLFWTVVQEGQVKSIEVNRRFGRLIMSYENHEFNGQTRSALSIKFPVWDAETNGWIWKNKKPKKSPLNMWEVIERKEPPLPKSWFRRNFGYLRWIGFWPIAKVGERRLTWTSLEQRPNREGVTELVPVTTDQIVDYVVLQWDVYGLILKSIETEGLLPVDILLVLPARVVNPYRALYSVQHWLEVSENRIADAVRLFVGATGFMELIQRAKGDPERGKITDEELGGILATIFLEYGVEIPYVGIRRVDPASDVTKDFVLASGAVFVAERKAAANRIEGEGLRERVLQYYGAAAEIQGGRDMFMAEAIRDSRITVFAPGDTNKFLPTYDTSGIPSTPRERTQDSEGGGT